MTSDLSTALVAIGLALALGFVVFSMIRRNKKGGPTCGCGCDHCAMGPVCRGDHDDKRDTQGRT